MRKGTHMFNPWEINHNRADNAMFTYFKQHVSNVAREHIVVTHGVPCLHWCDAAIGWCFRTGARQTWHRNDKKLPLKWLCYLLLEALKEKKKIIHIQNIKINALLYPFSTLFHSHRSTATENRRKNCGLTPKVCSSQHRARLCWQDLPSASAA